MDGASGTARPRLKLGEEISEVEGGDGIGEDIRLDTLS